MSAAIDRQHDLPGIDPSHPPQWAGWIRPASSPRWTQVCTGQDYSSCWSELLTAAGGNRHCQRLVTPIGDDPNHRPARPRRRF